MYIRRRKGTSKQNEQGTCSDQWPKSVTRDKENGGKGEGYPSKSGMISCLNSHQEPASASEIETPGLRLTGRY